MVQYAKKYLSNFNYNEELKVFKSEPSRFVAFGPKGKRGNYRRMEAFIFRRIHNKEMTLVQMKMWVDIIQKDLNALK